MIQLTYIAAIDFLSTAGWWGLLGLLVPFIIHLLSKKEKNIVPFGSLRFLQSIESDSAQSIQLSQYLLLLCRLLLVGLIGLLLFGPIMKTDITSKAIWVEEGIYNNSDYQQLWSDLTEDQVINLYSHEVSDSTGVQHFQSIWTLINKLNDNTDSSIVYSHSLQKHFVGNPVELSPKVEWNIVPFKYGGSKALPKSVTADQEHISISKEIGEGESSIDEVLSLQLIASDRDKEVAQLKKVIELSKGYLTYDINWITSEEESESDETWKIIIGVSESRNYNKSIHWFPSDQQLEVVAINEQSLSLSGKIDKENIIESNLPVRLAAMFNNDMTDIYDYDIRTMHPDNLVHARLVTDTPVTDNIALATSETSLQNYILLLIIPIFLLERFLNYKSVEGS